MTPPAAPAPSVTLHLPIQRVWVTYVLLGLIGLTFLGQLALDPAGPRPDPILVLGAKENTLIAYGEVWRLLTAVFLHGSIMHFAFNAYALYNIGRQVEAPYGARRFGALFILTGLSGSVFSLWFNPHPAVGASGAVFGLIGAEGILLYRNRQLLGSRGRSALQNVVIIALINLAFGLQGNIDNWGHVGGLLGGLVLGWATGPVWAIQVEPLTPPMIVDTQPLTLGRWVLVGGFAFGLAVVTALNMVVVLSTR